MQIKQDTYFLQRKYSYNVEKVLFEHIFSNKQFIALNNVYERSKKNSVKNSE